MFPFIDAAIVALIVFGAAGYLAWFFWKMLKPEKNVGCKTGNGKCCGE